MKTHEEIHQILLNMRGVDQPCQRCGGSGVRAYPSTATWLGGAGGATVTADVCDLCWGTGDAHRKGADLKRMAAEMRGLRADRDRLLQLETANAALKKRLNAVLQLYRYYKNKYGRRKHPK